MGGGGDEREKAKGGGGGGDEREKAKGGGGGGGGGGGEYGTFQGPPSYPPPRPPVVGYPQPAPPPGLYGQGDPYYRPRGGYQGIPARDYEAGVRGHGHDRLPCCGIGIGWFLFIVGFFLGAIPWYVGAFLLWCSRVDYREKPGYVACAIAAALATIAIIIGATAGAA